MKIKELPIEYYIERLRKNEYFSFPGYSDAEWIAMLKTSIGNQTAAGQLWTDEIGDQLLTSIKAHRKDPSFMPAYPKIINQWGLGKEIEKFMYSHGLHNTTFYERDMVTDDLAAEAGLAPFIKQLRLMDVYLVGNITLRGLHFLNYKKHFVTETLYNFHVETRAIKTMVNDILEFGKPGVYLFSVGMSDAVMISELHGKMKDSFLIDVGSMWDAFVGMGGNRTWRQELYKDPKKWVEWVTKNLDGV